LSSVEFVKFANSELDNCKFDFFLQNVKFEHLKTGSVKCRIWRQGVGCKKCLNCKKNIFWQLYGSCHQALKLKWKSCFPKLAQSTMKILLTHNVAHSTRHSFRPKTNNQPIKKVFKSYVQLIKSRQKLDVILEYKVV